MLHLAGAASCVLAAIWLGRRPLTKRSDRGPTVAALLLTGLWSAVVAAYGSAAPAAALAEAARNLALLLVIYRLFAHDGRDLSMVQVRPLVVVLALVELLQPVLIYAAAYWVETPAQLATTTQIGVLFHVIVPIGALVLLHNLYFGAAPETRDALRWSAVGLAGLWAFELNHYVVAYLGVGATAGLDALRGLIAGLMAIPMVIGASNGLAGRRFMASHSVTFQTLSLLVIGAYLLLMTGTAQLLASIGGNFGRLAEIGFLVAAATVAMLWLPSRRLRGWLRVTALKHLFQHRYDYREEWMRFARTISQPVDGHGDLYQRAAKAMADIVDSSAAILFLPGDDGQLREVASWKWSEGRDEILVLPWDFPGRFEGEDYILEIDQLRARPAVGIPGLPDALLNMPEAWVLVPLVHFDRVCGAVLIAKPDQQRALDWEDFDLLKVVGRQLASYIAEHESHSALMESAQFDDFNRRIAFVIHDIKNLASQLSLLARNAEKHAENPEFRQDMLVTLRNGSDKLTQLLGRLGRYGTPTGIEPREIDLVALARGVVSRFEAVHPVALVRASPCRVLVDADGLEQALVHLVQNAIDASAPDIPVSLDLSTDGLLAKLEIIDSGCGMDADFVRHRLFKPFVSSRDGGFGIGAYEARELVRAMGGRLDVQSRPGIGTRFSITMPLAQAARFLKSANGQEAA